MTVNYSDPWKDDPYGKLKGNKQTAYFKIILDEAKLYPIDNGYVLAAYVSKYEGILRSFKPERPLEQGLCAIPLYSQDYETRRKEGEKWISVPQRPSKFEQALCKYIEQNKNVFLDEKLVLSGELTHIPDGMCASLDANALNTLVADNFQVQSIPPSGLLKEYTPPSSKNGKGKSGNYYKGMSPDEKLAFVKKELVDSTGDETVNEEMSLAALIVTLKDKHSGDETLLAAYFDVLTALIK